MRYFTSTLYYVYEMVFNLIFINIYILKTQMKLNACTGYLNKVNGCVDVTLSHQ